MSTRVTVRYFALIREQVGKDSETVEIEGEATAGGLLELLCSRYPVIEALRKQLRLAVNLRFADAADSLGDGDEVALIPPVAGGEARCRLTEEPLDPLAVIAAVKDDCYGAIVTFIGAVRNENLGRAVSFIEYEAYRPMALAKLEEIAHEVDSRWPGCSLRVEHRLGRLEVGEDSVVIAVAAGHRAEAFQACSTIIDRIKEIVPIWKREVGPDGSSWV